MHRLRSPQRGFTLIELMITVGIVAILSTIVYKSYQKSVIEADRADAKNALINAAQTLERCYAQNYYYYNATTDCPNVPPTSGTTMLSTNGWYAITAPTRTASAYTLTATPYAGMPLRDTQCTSLSLDNLGNKTSAGTASASICWGGS